MLGGAKYLGCILNRLALSQRSVHFSWRYFSLWIRHQMLCWTHSTNYRTPNTISQKILNRIFLVQKILPSFRSPCTNSTIFSQLLYLCAQRGLQPDSQTTLAEIYCAERARTTTKSDALIKRYTTQYANKYEAFGAACCGAAKSGHIDRLRVLLRQSVVNDPDNDRYILEIPQESIFDIIWSLAENSHDGMGKKWSSLVQQVWFRDDF